MCTRAHAHAAALCCKDHRALRRQHRSLPFPPSVRAAGWLPLLCARVNRWRSAWRRAALSSWAASGSRRITASRSSTATPKSVRVHTSRESRQLLSAQTLFGRRVAVAHPSVGLHISYRREYSFEMLCV
eukprot:384250-Pleurochrysis_carterae.AAC.1